MDQNELDKIRSEIDEVDRGLSRMLEKRIHLVSRVAEYKKHSGREILDKTREERVIENVLSVVVNPDLKDNIKEIFVHIMANSREYQKKKLSEAKSSVRRYALIGEHLSHSLSPVIHRLFFEKTGIKGTYELLEIPPQELRKFLGQLYEEGFSGINVTIPYKTEVMKSLDVLSDEVLRVGAVNTVKLGETLKGYNTDYHGFGKALLHYGFETRQKACAVLGSGGSSRAIVSWLEDHGASRIAIVTRDPDSAGLKYPGLQCVDISLFSASGFDLVVNATPVGMWPKTGSSPLTKSQLQGAGFVMDLIYNPKETLLLEFCSELGITCANGLYMLVAQAVYAQEIWQGLPCDEALINSIYEEMKSL